MIEYDERFGYRHHYRDRYAGLPVAHAHMATDEQPTDPGGVAWRVESPWDSGDDVVEHLRRLLDTVDTGRMTALVIGNWAEDYGGDCEPIVRTLADNAGALPALRSLFFGDDETELCWIKQSDITPLLTAFPRLERLEVRGGTGLALTPVRHESLRVLRIETAGLPGHVVGAVATCDLPALEHLELWLGEEPWGGDATVADLGPLLTGERLPALRHLGLQDSEIQDAIAAAVASAPVVARLETLALSMGTLTDAGAEALLSGQPLTHLRRLDLHHHFLTDAMMERVTRALPDVHVDLSSQEKPDVGGGEIRRYVAMGGE